MVHTDSDVDYRDYDDKVMNHCYENRGNGKIIGNNFLIEG